MSLLIASILFSICGFSLPAALVLIFLPPHKLYFATDLSLSFIFIYFVILPVMSILAFKSMRHLKSVQFISDQDIYLAACFSLAASMLAVYTYLPKVGEALKRVKQNKHSLKV